MNKFTKLSVFATLLLCWIPDFTKIIAANKDQAHNFETTEHGNLSDVESSNDSTDHVIDSNVSKNASIKIDDTISKSELENLLQVIMNETSVRFREIPRRLEKLEKKILKSEKLKRNCADILSAGDEESGVRTIYPFYDSLDKPVNVFCDQKTSGGGWTVIQRRGPFKKQENFDRTWAKFETGFGDRNGEYWLGLFTIHALVKDKQKPMELRIDIEDYNNKKQWIQYDSFYIGNETTFYQLQIGPPTIGNATHDALTNNHNGQKFTTKDNDNDKSSINCAVKYQGGWWHDDCYTTNLNGPRYIHVEPYGLAWWGKSQNSAKMMIRPKA